MSFPARYGGTCGRCDQRFPEGTLIEYTDDDELVHAAGNCPSESSDLYPASRLDTFVNRPPPICGRCYLAHAGDCGE